MDTKIEYPEEYLIPELIPFLAKVGEDNHVRHFLCWSTLPIHPHEKSSDNWIMNKRFSFILAEYSECLKTKDYDNFLISLDKECYITWFLKDYKRVYKDLGDKEYFKLFSEILTYIDNHDPYRKYYSRLISIGNDPLNMMSKNERKEFDNLPDKFKVYRGTSSNKGITDGNLKKLLGNSWSIDREISIWFAMNHSTKYRGSDYIILLTYEVNKSEIVSYFTERNENEIFLDYTKIDLDRVSYEYIPKEYKCKVSFNNSSN